MEVYQRHLLFNLIPLDCLSENQVLKKVQRWIIRKEKKRIFYLNVHNTVISYKNPNYLTIINSGDLVYPDGWGPVIAMRLLGNKCFKRVNAADYIDKLLEILNLEKAKLYFLGSEKETLIQTIKTIHDKYKGITISGYHHGFFKKSEEKIIVSEIKSLEPNLVFIGMGTPKQEQWVNNNWDFLPQAVYWCVGGLFGYVSEVKSRAPYWMRELSLEWFYRLIQEPSRLGVRYTVENALFIFFLLKFLVKKVKFII